MENNGGNNIAHIEKYRTVQGKERRSFLPIFAKMGLDENDVKENTDKPYKAKSKFKDEATREKNEEMRIDSLKDKVREKSDNDTYREQDSSDRYSDFNKWGR